MERRDAVEINWGSLGHKERYMSLLQKRVRLGWLTAITMGLGALCLMHWAMEHAAQNLDNGVLTFVLLGSVFLIVILFLSSLLRQLDYRLRSIEIFFDFYEDRGLVRHQIFCKNPLHCSALHYFNHIDKGLPDK